VIRVLVADDHPMVRAGLEELIGASADMHVVGAAADGDEAVELARSCRPDVVVMDLSMPGTDGAEATRRILGEQPGVRVVVLTSFSDRARILDAVDAGATGYLLKDGAPHALLDGIRVAHAGESPLAPKAAAAVLSQVRRSAPDLTGREREVLVLIGAGLPNKRIAGRLGISEQTVKSHVTSIFQRIGVSDRTNAALWARRRGLG
jgi:DNA-binding NarL/FixJ family response regulator